MANEIFFTYVYYIQVCTYNTNFVYISYIKKKIHYKIEYGHHVSTQISENWLKRKYFNIQ